MSPPRKPTVEKYVIYRTRVKEELFRPLLPCLVTKGTFSIVPPGANIADMSTGTGQAKSRCAQCEMLESQCECDKYCCLCQTALDVRICTDGLMYCHDCRTACDYKTVD
jgi:hypothetical protein